MNFRMLLALCGHSFGSFGSRVNNEVTFGDHNTTAECRALRYVLIGLRRAQHPRHTAQLLADEYGHPQIPAVDGGGGLDRPPRRVAFTTVAAHGGSAFRVRLGFAMARRGLSDTPTDISVGATRAPLLVYRSTRQG